MSTLELIRGYKSKPTPLAVGDNILSYYRRSLKETSANDKIYSFILSDNEPVVCVTETSTLLKTMLEKNSRKYIQLYSEFMDKWSVKKEYFNDFQESFVFEKIKYTLDGILELNPSYVTFDLTEDCSSFFQASVNGKNIYFELFFAKDVDGEVEAVTNIYENGKCTFAYGGTIEDTFSKINLQVTKTTWCFEPTEYHYVLSDSIITAATF